MKYLKKYIYFAKVDETGIISVDLNLDDIDYVECSLYGCIFMIKEIET